jgi:hypothetical protein
MSGLQKLREYTLTDVIKSTGWFSRLIILGGCLLFIDSLLELSTSPAGLLTLIFSVVIIILSTQIQDDIPSAYIHIIIVLIMNYILQIYFHQSIGVNWVSGLGYLGYILINIAGSVALIFIIISVAASVNKDPIDDRWLFIVGYILFGVNLIIFLNSNEWLLVGNSMLAIFYFAMITICIILALLDQTLIGGLAIWIISLIIIIGGIFNTPLSSSVTGFGAGLPIIGNIAGMYFLNEFGYLITGGKKEVK